MVVDWKKQIDECINQTKVMPIFIGVPIEKRLQEYYIVKRLISMGYDNHKILSWFQLAEDDCIKTLDDIDDLIENAAKRKNPKERDYTIYITQEEIDFVNNLKASRECKQYLLGIVAFAKVTKIKKGVPTFNVRERSFIYFLAFGADKYFHRHRYEVMNNFVHKLQVNKTLKTYSKTSKIKHYNGTPGGYYVYVENTIIKADWINYEATDGYKIDDIAHQLPIICNTVIQDPTRICECCGKEFAISPKTKRKLCDECYKLYRQEYKKDPKYHLQWNKHKDKAGTGKDVALNSE